jgi:hypothetical protein
VNLKKSLDERTKAIEQLRTELSDAKSLGVHQAGANSGSEESQQLKSTLTSVLTADLTQVFFKDPNVRAEAELAIEEMVKQISNVEDKLNPLINLGNLVCLEVAEELVNRLAVYLDLNKALEQAGKDISGQALKISDQELGETAEKWKKNLQLSSTEAAKGLYKLAQEVGETIGKNMRNRDRNNKIARLHLLKQHCQPGSAMLDAVDGLYERIAKRVATKLAQSLVVPIQKLPKAMYSTVEKSEFAPTTAFEMRKRKPKVSGVSVQPVGQALITSPGNPASNLQQSLDPQPAAQSPRTAVQQASGDEEETTIPPNSENSGGTPRNKDV